MFKTTEVRWFFQGKIPQKVGLWFERLEETTIDLEPRIDRYLGNVSTSRLGIKIREGNIEIKQQVGADDEWNTSRLHGKVQEWRKWSFALADDLDAVKCIPYGLWIAVRKERKLIRYALDDQKNALQVLLLNQEPGNTLICEVELTLVQVEPSETWWTICFEANHPQGDSRIGLTRTLNAVLSENSPVNLTMESSQSYVDWLARLDLS